MATKMQALEAAMSEATASRAPVARKLHTTEAEYAAARADLDARARAGKTVQNHDAKGHFTRGVKMFTVGRPAVTAHNAPVQKAAEAPKATARPVLDRAAPALAIAAE